jgi:4-hydroxy-3-polyprenylbenzoate decarboxylase
VAYNGLQHFIKKLEESGELIRIKEFVNPKLEITEVTDRVSKQPGGGKALLFENTGTDFPLLINSFGSEKRMCMSLGAKNLDESGTRISALLDQFTITKTNIWTKLKILPALKEISSWLPSHKNGRGICQEIIMPEPDINRLPILKCWPQDGGHFITLPLVNTIDPETAIRNVGMYRMQVYSSNSTGMHWHRHKTGARHFELYKKIGKRMPVAVVLGGDPVYTYAATAPLPDNIDEYLFAGFLRGKKVDLVKCLTQDIEVPSDADFVIEGYVDPVEPLALEGPFGDHTGFYSLADKYPVFHITCITHRMDAVYPATIVGIPPQEDAWIAKATERIFLTPIRMALAPEIIDMNLPIEGIAHNLAIVKINKTYPGQAFKVMNALWGAGQMMFNKLLIVTGNETDIFSPFEILKSILIHVNNPIHFNFLTGPADVLDHASQSFTYGGKLCIDATIKLPEELYYDEQQKRGKENLNGLNEIHFNLSEIKKILNNYPDITGSNISFLEKGLGLLILTVDKKRKHLVNELNSEFFQFPAFNGIKFIVFLDKDEPIHQYSYITWLILGNVDPVRDCYIIKNENAFCMAIDGTKKNFEFDDFKREWPSIIVSDDDTIKKIDEKWASLGLGEIINSPSLLIKNKTS